MELCFFRLLVAFVVVVVAVADLDTMESGNEAVAVHKDQWIDPYDLDFRPPSRLAAASDEKSRTESNQVESYETEIDGIDDEHKVEHKESQGVKKDNVYNVVLSKDKNEREDESATPNGPYELMQRMYNAPVKANRLFVKPRRANSATRSEKAQKVSMAAPKEERRKSEEGDDIDSLTEKCNKELQACRIHLASNQAHIAKTAKMKTDKPSLPYRVKEDEKTCEVDMVEQLTFRRHVGLLLRKLDIVSKLQNSRDEKGNDMDATMQFSAELTITSIQARQLLSFSQSEGSISIDLVDDILSNLIGDVRDFTNQGERIMFQDLFTFPFSLSVGERESLFWFCLLLFFAIFLFVLAYRSAIGKLLSVGLFLLVTSTCWHWMHLYKKALSRKSSTLTKFDHEMPIQCQPDRMSWAHALYTYLFPSQKDECAVYHEAVLVDPLWEVSPTVALADMTSSLLLHPLANFGSSLGKFFSHLLNELGFFSSICVLAFVFVSLILVLIMIFGYRIRLPFFLGCIEPHFQSPMYKMEIKKMASESELLKRELSELQLRMNKLTVTETLALNSPGNTAVAVVQSQVTMVETEEIGYEEPCVSNDNKDSSPVVAIDEDKPQKIHNLSKKGEGATANECKSAPVTPSKASNRQQSPIRTPMNEDLKRSLSVTPRKRLAIRGSATSPYDTDFEWVVDDGESGDVASSTLITDESADTLSDTKDQTSYLEKVQTIFDSSEDL